MLFNTHGLSRTYLDPATVARELGISVQTLKRLRLAGQISHYRPTPRKVLFTVEQVQDFRTRREVQAKAA